MGDEPLKITVAAKSYGFRGTQLADNPRANDIEREFADPDFTVFMVTPEIGTKGLARLTDALLAIPPRPLIVSEMPRLSRPEAVMSVRQAAFATREELPAESCNGRIFAGAAMGCPPAVPIVIYGERIGRDAIDCFSYYGIDRCSVVTEL